MANLDIREASYRGTYWNDAPGARPNPRPGSDVADETNTGVDIRMRTSTSSFYPTRF